MIRPEVRKEERVGNVVDFLFREEGQDVGAYFDGLPDGGLFVETVLSHGGAIDSLDGKGMHHDTLGSTDALDHGLDDDETGGQCEFIVGKLFLDKNDIGLVGQILNIIHELHGAIECIFHHDFMAVKNIDAF